MLKVIFRNYRSHYSEEDLMRMEGDDIFVPQMGDRIILNDIFVVGKVVKRVVLYNSQSDVIAVTIELELE